MKFNCFILTLTALVLFTSLGGCMSTLGIQAQSNPAPVTTAALETTLTPTTVPAVTLPDYVEVSREGEVSRIPVQTVTGTVGNYLIAMDPEYFTFSSYETVDMFSYDPWGGEQSVFFCISAYEKTDPQQFITDVINQYDGQYQAVNVEDTTIGGYSATAVYLQSAREHPDYNKHVFLIHCGEEMFVLEVQFVTEMYEGLYAIMRALFDTFTAF